MLSILGSLFVGRVLDPLTKMVFSSLGQKAVDLQLGPVKRYLDSIPLQRAFQKAIANAYKRFSQEYPDLIASLFDDYFLKHGAVPVLTHYLQRATPPDRDSLTIALTEAWKHQSGIAPSEQEQARITLAAAKFLDFMEQELRSFPVFDLLRLLWTAEENKAAHIEIRDILTRFVGAITQLQEGYTLQQEELARIVKALEQITAVQPTLYANSIVTLLPEDIISHGWDELDTHNTLLTPQLAAERTRFELLISKRPIRGWTDLHQTTIYVVPTLLWKEDIDQDEFLHDPDVREARLQRSGGILIPSWRELVARKRVLITGEFNAGKTRLLEYIIEKLLQQKATVADPSTPLPALPILIALRHYRNPKLPFLTYVLQSVQETYIDAAEEAPSLATLDAIFRTGNYVFLFDGLDELGGSEQPALLESIHSFINQYPYHTYLLTGRRSGYGTAEQILQALQFEQLVITPFSTKQIKHYLQLRGLSGTRFADLLESQSRDLQALARVPGSMKVLCDISGQTGDPPLQLGDIYEALITDLLSKERVRQTAVIQNEGLTRLVLNRLAFEMQREQTYSLSQAEMEQWIYRIIRKLDLATSFSAREWIEEICFREILLTDGSHVTFQPRSWQSYLAACALEHQPLDTILHEVYLESASIQGFSPWWYQTLLFLAERRADVLTMLFEREEITGARCTPSAAPPEQRLRSLQVLFSTATTQQVGMPGRYDSGSDILNDRQKCIDLNPPGAVTYLSTQFLNSSILPARELAFDLLVDYAALDNDEAKEIIINWLPGLLTLEQEDWGLRESAAYAVAALDLPTFVPQLLALYEIEHNEHVRQAILWSLASLAPQAARTIFIDLLLRSFGPSPLHGMEQTALKVALPRLFDDQLASMVRDHLRSTTHEIWAVPDYLIDLLIDLDTSTSRETLLVIVTHIVIYNLPTETRDKIYGTLSHDRVAAVQFLLEHIQESYVGIQNIAYYYSAS